MMGQLDKHPRPAWAITAWISDDERSIFVEWPMTSGGPPFIQRYDANEHGLREALFALKARRREVELPTMDRPANYTPPANQPQVKLSPRELQRRELYAQTTEAQREAAQKLVAKLGRK